jgi:predicted DNA-binding protein (UPF0251 family)
VPRPFRCRRISCNPEYRYFKPRGIPLSELEELNLGLDELEAIRLADKEGLYQEKAAEKMNVSRQTFGNILNSAHKKVAEFLTEGKALSIKGGVIKMMERHFLCYACKNEWGMPCGTGRPQECPKCKSANIHRAPQDRGWGRGGRCGRGTACGRVSQ